MKSLYQLLSLFLLVSVLLGACAPGTAALATEEPPSGKLPASASQEMTLYVADHMAECSGSGVTSCLLVREDLSVDFELFYDSIDGFNYEPGFVYELRVIRTEVENPPADGSLYRWVLLEEISKNPVEGLMDAPMTLPTIIGEEWAWVRTSGAENNIEVNGPERYTLKLMEDGTFTARLDCNSMSGTYTIEDSKLKLVPGPMTLMACAEGSQADAFLEGLNSASTILMTEFGLTIELSSGGAMFFAFNDVAVVEEAMTTPSLDELVGTSWQWAGTVTGESAMEVAPSEAYTIEFFSDGTFQAQADCIYVEGAFVLDEAALQITPGPMTLAICIEGSLSEPFISQLSSSAIVFMLNGDLYIDMIYDSGTMHFVAP